MITENFYDVIFKRKSIRKYTIDPLNDEVLTEIETYIKNVKPLYENIRTEIKVVSSSSMSSLISIKAPHYLVFTSEKKDGYLTNAGFMLQFINLFLEINGIGSCYLGMAQPGKEFKAKSELEVAIVLSIGNASEPLYRDSTGELKRKAYSEITNMPYNDKIIEAARFAPSAVNSQPWYFTGEDGLIHSYCIKSNIIKALIYERMNKIDMGIALCHIAVAAEHFNKQVEFFCDNAAKDNPPKGFYYCISARIR